MKKRIGNNVCFKISIFLLQTNTQARGTLVSQIIVQQTLLDFRNFPTCTPLFQPALLLDFEIYKQKP